jgi:hypothetical protein
MDPGVNRIKKLAILPHVEACQEHCNGSGKLTHRPGGGHI